MMTVSRILLILNIVIQTYDAWSTITIINSGKGKEGNELIARLIARFGLVPAVAGKSVLFSGIMAGLVWRYGQYWPIPVALGALGVFYVSRFWNHNFKHDGI